MALRFLLDVLNVDLDPWQRDILDRFLPLFSRLGVKGD